MSDIEAERKRFNHVAAEIATKIIMESGSRPADGEAIMLMLEAVVGGVITSIVPKGKEEIAFDILVAGIRQRMGDIKLYGATPRGNA